MMAGYFRGVGNDISVGKSGKHSHQQLWKERERAKGREREAQKKNHGRNFPCKCMRGHVGVSLMV